MTSATDTIKQTPWTIKDKKSGRNWFWFRTKKDAENFLKNDVSDYDKKRFIADKLASNENFGLARTRKHAISKIR